MMDIKLHLGNCLEVLTTLEENSIDTCITDPPYELGFMGKDWDSAGVSFQKETWEAVYRVLKPGAFLLAFGGTRTSHRIATAIEDAGFEIRDTICWLYGQGFPKSHNISKAIDKKAGAEREVIGYDERFRGQTRAIGGNGIYGGITKPNNRSITVPTTPEAELWEGWGTALKPAFEPIIVAMKPIDGTFVENALKYGVAGLWIDGGRIVTNPELDDPRLGGKGSWKTDKAAQNVYEGGYAGKDIASSPDGRWPANLLLDEEAAKLLDKQTGIQKGGFVRNRTDGARPFENKGKDTGYETVAEIKEPSGGASRFFYCAKASKKERNKVKGNSHPTVKPLALIQYLVRLTKTPTGGVVIDPFMGSGTTGVACVQSGRDFIGIEIKPKYFEIAEKRIKEAQIQPRLGI